MSDTIFGLTATANNGKEVALRDYEGNVLLMVNTASKCGFTPQYKGLEALYKKYKDKGLVLIGFPCDQFAHQEPGSAAEIAQFCELNFGVTFPLMAKIDVNGPATHPIFKLLKESAPGVIGEGIKWNFTKFLVSRDGASVTRFAPSTEPEQMEKEIQEALDEWSTPELLLSNQLCFLVHRLDRAIRNARYRPLLGELGLTYPQYLAMLALWEHEELGIGDLCALLDLDTGTVSPLIKRLEAAGLVDRKRRADDERAVSVRLSSNGRALEKRAKGIPGALASCILTSAGEYESLKSTLSTLIGRLENPECGD